jgi:hypothetical protein
MKLERRTDASPKNFIRTIMPAVKKLLEKFRRLTPYWEMPEGGKNTSSKYQKNR